jgi:hypothetical protein
MFKQFWLEDKPNSLLMVLNTTGSCGTDPCVFKCIFNVHRKNLSIFSYYKNETKPPPLLWAFFDGKFSAELLNVSVSLL